MRRVWYPAAALAAALLSFVTLASCAPLGASALGEAELAKAGRAFSGAIIPGRPAVDGAASFRARARAAAATFAVEDLAGQLLLVGIDGKGSLPRTARDLLATVRPGGIVLFGFNVPLDPRGLGIFLGLAQDEARSAGLRAPLLAAIDHEGGAVFRFKAGMTRIPSASDLGSLGEAAVKASGSIAGSELRALGVTLNLAPVAEAVDPAAFSFLGERSFSANPATAGRMAASYVRSLQAEGVGAVLKHYPGSAALDPHQGLPVLDASLEELSRRYERPFSLALEAGPTAVMLSQLSVPALDPDHPVSWSAKAIARLRGLGFRGLVLTDDVAMKASLSLLPAEEAAIRAIEAGADMVMVSGGPYTARVASALRVAIDSGRLDRERVLEACANILAWKFALGLEKEQEPDLRRSRLDALAALVASRQTVFD